MRIVLACGWRRALIAFVAGAVSALALAPFDAWPVLFVTFPVLVWLVDGAAAGRWAACRAAAIAGWWFGFGYFLAGLYWVGYAFLVDAKTFGWLLPFAVAGLPAYLACYTGARARRSRACSGRAGRRALLALAVALTVAEWLRGHLFSGFPWNIYGYALTGPLVLAQGASLIGIWGLTFVAVAVFASPAVLTDERADTPAAVAAAARSASSLLAALAGYGAMRLSTHADRASSTTCSCASCSPICSRTRSSTTPPRTQVMSRYLRAVRPRHRPAIERRATTSRI